MERTKTEADARAVDWSRVIETYRPLHIRYPHGELIFQVGTYAAGTSLISTGLVSDRCAAPTGGHRTPPLEILGPGDLIGFEVLLEQHNDLHLSCARAVTDTELFFFERDLFLRVLEKEEEVERYCLASLARRFYALKQRTVSLFTSPVEERLGRLLLDLADRCGEPHEGETVALPLEITLSILAQLLGRSTGRVNRALGLLPGISHEGEQLILSCEALRTWLASATEAQKRR